MKARRMLVGIVLVAMFVVTGQVFAGGFNLIIPGIGGSTSTNIEAKLGNCTQVTLSVGQTGGNFTVNAGAKNLAGQDISPFARVRTGSFVSFPENLGNCAAGSQRYMQFSTDINSVSVQISGVWSPG